MGALWADILTLLEHQVAGNGFAPGYSHFLEPVRRRATRLRPGACGTIHRWTRLDTGSR